MTMQPLTAADCRIIAKLKARLKRGDSLNQIMLSTRGGTLYLTRLERDRLERIAKARGVPVASLLNTRNHRSKRYAVRKTNHNVSNHALHVSHLSCSA
jgi:arsenate reductase-like glutaredoxin family protein